MVAVMYSELINKESFSAILDNNYNYYLKSLGKHYAIAFTTAPVHIPPQSV